MVIQITNSEKIIKNQTNTSKKNKTNEIVESIFSLLDYKNKNYGNAAAQPLNIFSKLNDTIKVGTRLDDKLARIKNSDTLRKNDIADVIGYLLLAISISSGKSYKEYSKSLNHILNNELKFEILYNHLIKEPIKDFVFKDRSFKYSILTNKLLKYIQITDKDEIGNYDFLCLISLLIFLCKEKGWTNFDEFKD